MNIINDGVLFNTREYGEIMVVTRQVVTLQLFVTGTNRSLLLIIDRSLSKHNDIFCLIT